MNWKPIADAPKDRRILLYRPTSTNYRIVMGRFHSDEYAKNPRPYWTHDAELMEGRISARNNPPTLWCDPEELAQNA